MAGFVLDGDETSLSAAAALFIHVYICIHTFV
jgi:hypothetical protein